MSAQGFADGLTCHLEYEAVRTDPYTASAWIARRDDLCDARGALRTAVVAYLVDATAGVVCGSAAVPRWVVTADLQFRMISDARGGPFRADAVAVRPGRRQSLGEVRVFDEGDDNRLIAIGTTNHLVVETTANVPTDMPIGVRYEPDRPAHLPAAPLDDLLEVRHFEPGTTELDVGGVAANPLGILHGAVIALLAEESVLALPDGDRFEISDMVLRFVGSLPVGHPARAVAEAVDDVGASRVGRVIVSNPHDESARVGALVSVGLRPKPV